MVGGKDRRHVDGRGGFGYAAFLVKNSGCSHGYTFLSKFKALMPDAAGQGVFYAEISVLLVDVDHRTGDLYRRRHRLAKSRGALEKARGLKADLVTDL